MLSKASYLACFIGLMVVLAASSFFILDKTEKNTQQHLQKGARIFVNFCAGCHSLQYLHYQDLAIDLNLTDENGQVEKQLLQHLLMKETNLNPSFSSSMRQVDQKKWLGVVPPDLSLIANIHGKKWLIQYLHGFYYDKRQTFGTNNKVLVNSIMPNVLQAWSEQVSTAECNQAVLDVAIFLQYVADPSRALRYRWGIVVLFFLLVEAVLIYQLRKAYK